ncbi:hypothetical protein BBK82_35925 [Lentzea guizhouensis]|uniref:Uncharacterized protein n=1 Tax=Lentzea guizhouensis TaxID=1586287 RepID=A0A1B2HS90_9PSEU|nr:hypothetical protein BBK82_35925 [Lentzea guizhouensis]
MAMASCWPSTSRPHTVARASSDSRPAAPWAMPKFACPPGVGMVVSGSRITHQPGNSMPPSWCGRVTRVTK